MDTDARGLDESKARRSAFVGSPEAVSSVRIPFASQAENVIAYSVEPEATRMAYKETGFRFEVSQARFANVRAPISVTLHRIARRSSLTSVPTRTAATSAPSGSERDSR